MTLKSTSGPTLRIAILASGRGSNAEVLIATAAELAPRLKIVAVLTDNPQAALVERAADWPLSLHILPYQRTAGQNSAEAKQAHEKGLLARLQALQVDWLLLAGYQRLLSPVFLSAFADPKLGQNRIINVHPSFLPQFPGKDAYRQAWEAGVSESGVTVHFVDAGIDTGAIIAQERFPRLGGDDFAMFSARGLELEHRLYPLVLRALAQGALYG